MTCWFTCMNGGWDGNIPPRMLMDSQIHVLCCKVVHWGRNFKVFNNMIRMATNLHLDYSSKSPTRNLFQKGFSFDETLLNLFLDLIWTKTLKSFEDADGPAGAGMGQYPQAQAEYGIFDWQNSVLGLCFFYRNPPTWWNLSKRKFQVGPLGPQTRKTSC